MYEEQMAHEYKKEHGVFPTYPVSDNKPVVYPEDMTDPEERIWFFKFGVRFNNASNTPRNLDKNFKRNPYGNGGGNHNDFINITGNPEYSR